MSTKGFFLLVITVAILGGSIGEAFVGGLVVGRSEDHGELAIIGLPGLEANSAFGARGAGQGIQRPGLSGDPSGGEPQGGTAGGFRLPGGTGGPTVINGTISQLEGNGLTIETDNGLVRATVDEETAIQRYEGGDLESLSAGERVLIIAAGPEEEGQDLVAASIVVNPPGGTGLFGRGFSGGRPPAP
jgi:hypothetical protein